MPVMAPVHVRQLVPRMRGNCVPASVVQRLFHFALWLFRRPKLCGSAFAGTHFGTQFCSGPELALGHLSFASTPPLKRGKPSLFFGRRPGSRRSSALSLASLPSPKPVPAVVSATAPPRSKPGRSSAPGPGGRSAAFASRRSRLVTSLSAGSSGGSAGDLAMTSILLGWKGAVRAHPPNWISTRLRCPNSVQDGYELNCRRGRAQGWGVSARHPRRGERRHDRLSYRART